METVFPNKLTCNTYMFASYCVQLAFSEQLVFQTRKTVFTVCNDTDEYDIKYQESEADQSVLNLRINPVGFKECLTL